MLILLSRRHQSANDISKCGLRLTFAVLSVSCLLANAQQRHSQSEIDKKLAQETVPQLISELAQIDSQSIGINSAVMYGGFIATGDLGNFEGGALGVAPPEISPVMKELVVRGPLALPDLVAHIDDKTPTRLKVGNINDGRPREIGVNAFMFTYFSNEYDPRFRSDYQAVRGVEKRFSDSYTVKVGDVCFALIGQIVNRRLLAVRYQPSAGLVVNSPIESPDLAERIRKDWPSKDPQGLRSSLRADVRGKNRRKGVSRSIDQAYTAFPALERLRLYFPDEYRELEKTDAATIRSFENRKPVN